MTFLKFNWAPNEKLFEIGGFGVHIYSMMFIIAFYWVYAYIKRCSSKKISIKNIWNPCLFIW